MRSRHRLVLVTVSGLVMAGLFAVGQPTATATGFGYDGLTARQQRLLSGFLTEALSSGPAATGSGSTTRFSHSVPPGCARDIGSNIRVNQQCLNLADPDLAGRSQAQNETWVAVDPFDSDRVVAAYNDYRRGDSTCGVSYSTDGGRDWADATAPTQFSRGAAFGAARQYWQGGGDPSVAWDTRGNVYLSCLTFNRGLAASPNPDQSSSLLMFRSTGTGGASWNFTGRPVAEHSAPAADGVLLDKQFLAVDASRTSRFRDRVYVTWTLFAADGTAYIFAAHSADYGETFSDPVLVSGDSARCGNTFGLPTPHGRCNVNQFSMPVTAPDGTLYVVWANYNNSVTGSDNRNQMLVARSTDGGASFGAPVKAGDFYELPDCAQYQGGANPGRSCVPEKAPTAVSVFRAANYPMIAVSPRDPRRVVVTYGSYISRNSNESNGCTPDGFNPATGGNRYTGVKDGGCNNDIVLSTSGDGGASFTGTAADVRTLALVSAADRHRRTDQFFHGTVFTPRGALVSAYYDRGYGDDERTGFSDISVSSGSWHRRATSSSMPPPTQFPPFPFYGDYIMVAATDRVALPVWSDTRNRAGFLCPGTGTPGNPPRVCTASSPLAEFANDQEVYTARIALP